MTPIDKLHGSALVVLLAAGLLLSGCGTPAAPQPPSLNLPEPVTDLAASRSGNQVALTWTMPWKNTDKLLLKGNIIARIYRGSLDTAIMEIALAPGSVGMFTDTLPAALTAGEPRILRYSVELRNRNGRSAGQSKAAPVLAGEAPAPVSGLSAELRKEGVLLRWTTAGAAANEFVRLQRKLLTPTPAPPPKGLLAPLPEPVEQNLLVDSCSPEVSTAGCRALDKSIRFGQSYEYRAERVARVPVDGKTLELAGELSAPVRVAARDTFPPAVPAALAAVATTGEDGVAPAIDLSWQPVADADLAGYILYRRQGEADWQRISPAEPLVPPAFHDTRVEPGHAYRYAVSAVDQGGHESARSAEAEETVPNP